MKITIYGCPRTKKNSQRMVWNEKRRKYIPIPSEAYEQYERDAKLQIIGRYRQQLSGPVNVKCVYYMETRRRVDLVNLLEATDDILVATSVLLDDNSQVIAGHDGSRVRYDKNCPRVEIEITEMETNEEPSPV